MQADPIEVTKLPVSTAETDEGPVLEASPGRVVLRYDVEADSCRLSLPLTPI